MFFLGTLRVDQLPEQVVISGRTGVDNQSGRRWQSYHLEEAGTVFPYPAIPEGNLYTDVSMATEQKAYRFVNIPGTSIQGFLLSIQSKEPM